MNAGGLPIAVALPTHGRRGGQRAALMGNAQRLPEPETQGFDPGSPMDTGEFDVLNTAGRLPSPKGVALRLMRLIQSETVSTGEMARTIKSDAPLAGRVLPAANASVHYNGRRYASIPEALTVVGTAVTYRLVLGLSVISSTSSGRCRQFDYQRHWLHSVIVALAMQALAERTRLLPAEDAFTAGLM